MVTVITSFSSLMTGEGETVCFTYSQFDEDGNKKLDNQKVSTVFIKEEHKEAINRVREILLAKIPE